MITHAPSGMEWKRVKYSQNYALKMSVVINYTDVFQLLTLIKIPFLLVVWQCVINCLFYVCCMFQSNCFHTFNYTLNVTCVTECLKLFCLIGKFVVRIYIYMYYDCLFYTCTCVMTARYHSWFIFYNLPFIDWKA